MICRSPGRLFCAHGHSGDPADISAAVGSILPGAVFLGHSLLCSLAIPCWTCSGVLIFQLLNHLKSTSELITLVVTFKTCQWFSPEDSPGEPCFKGAAPQQPLSRESSSTKPRAKRIECFQHFFKLMSLRVAPVPGTWKKKPQRCWRWNLNNQF